MPEGPEIRRVADRLAAAAVGQRLERAWFSRPELARRQRALVGRRVLSIEPRGKALLTSFEGGLTLYTHNQLYGRWVLAAAGERPETKRSLRVALETRRAALLLYSASEVELWPTADLDAHPFLQGLGPDALDERLDVRAVTERLAAPAFRTRALGALLLDQGFIAGLGNYLRAEILYEAGLGPDVRPADLDDARRGRLAKAIVALPRHSYRTRGDEAPATFHFRVFRREGEACERCFGPIARSAVTSRPFYFCPRCQQYGK